MKNIRLWMLLGSILFFSGTFISAAPLTPPAKEQNKKEVSQLEKQKKSWKFWQQEKFSAPKDEGKSFPWLSAFALFFGVAWIVFMALQVYFFSFYWGFAILSAVAAIVLGIFGLKTESYKKMAIAGIVLGVVGLLGGLMYLFTAVLMI